MSENIRIGVFPLEKDAQTCFEKPSCKQPGAEVEVLKMVFKLIGVNYTIIDVWKEFGEQYDFGAKLPNGSWSGMIGLLIEGKLDVIGLSMRMSPEREEAILFSYPTRYFESIFIVAPPSLTCTRQFIFNAFSRTVWIFIVFSVLLLHGTGVFLTFVKVMSESRKMRMSQVFIEMFSTNAATFKISSKVLLLVMLFTSFILSLLYQTDMYAFLSVPLSYDIPFRSIKEALDLVEQKKMYFAAFGTQTMLCTPATCNRFEQVVKKNPIRRAFSEKDVQALIQRGGIYQSTVDSALLPGQLSWLNTDQKFLIVRDEDAPSYYVAFTFSKKQKKLLKKFNKALIEILPSVAIITTGHGYNTKKMPFEIRTNNPKSPLSINNHLWQLFRSFLIAISTCLFVFAIENLFQFLKRLRKSKSYVVNLDNKI